MNQPHCCHASPSIPARRSCQTAGGLVAGVVLALMPKCPMCFAAYLAAWTGLSLSLATASYLRAALLILCTLALLYLTTRLLRRFLPYAIRSK